VRDSLDGILGHAEPRRTSWSCYSLRHAYAAERNEPAALVLPLEFLSAARTDGTLVGRVSLEALYGFMAQFEMQAQNLNMLYEANLRFEKPGSRVNAGMRETLASEPEAFGSYNNGLSLIVEGMAWDPESRVAALTAPQVINGCQTSKTIYRFIHEGVLSTGHMPAGMGSGFVAVKVLCVARDDNGKRAETVRRITRYANSQNKVQEADLLRHDPRLKQLAAHLHARDIFLELQSGSWKAQDKNEREAYETVITTDELIRLLAASFLGAPGYAYGTLRALLPGGTQLDPKALRGFLGGSCGVGAAKGTGTQNYYETLMGLDPDCVLAALAFRSAYRERYSKERLAATPGRREVPYPFYATCMKLLCQNGTTGGIATPGDMARAILDPKNAGLMRQVYDHAAAILADYLDEENGIFRSEPLFLEKGADLNKFLKSAEFGDPNACRTLANLVAMDAASI
ncbi:MAG: AIPR family protein, partial [Desulfobacterales bacterium]|nr:AIPR family protein [Desulfobacterales bacterium]